MKKIIKMILSKITKSVEISVALYVDLSNPVKILVSRNDFDHLFTPIEIAEQKVNILEIKRHKRKFTNKFFFLSKYWPLCDIRQRKVLEKVNALKFARKYYLKRNIESNSILYTYKDKDYMLFFQKN